jgi:PBSX family phage terminase large subunit
MEISKKQNSLREDIIAKNKYEIFVLGSTQSGKTFIISEALIEYSQALYNYDPNKQYYGAIIGWTISALDGNIVEALKLHLNSYGLKNNRDYKLVWKNEEKSISLFNIKYFFSGFNNVKSFNNILGKPLICIWVDESARIYSYKELHDSYKQLNGRQMSFAGHPYLKRIESFNVEGSDRHPYKVDYIDNKPNAIHYTFFPYDNPLLDTKEKINQVVNMFPAGSLREQKVFNRWVVAEGKVFNQLNIIQELPKHYIIREIIIGIDYGSVNPTTFVPIALCFDQVMKQWKMVRLKIYYHDSKIENDNPTTEYYSTQLRMFMVYLKSIYPGIPITNIVVDSEASHFDNRLTVDGIPHSMTHKITVDEGVQYMQSLFYKGYLETLESPSIRYFTNDGHYQESGKDEGVIELDSYQYDKIKSENTGTNCYKKDLDHSIDAERYALILMKDLGLAPVV